MKNCSVCSALIIDRRSDAKFCSRRCYIDNTTRVRRESGKLRNRPIEERQRRAEWMKDNRTRYRDARSCAKCGAEFFAKHETMSTLCMDCRWFAKREVVLWVGLAPAAPVVALKGAWWCAGQCRVCGSSFVSSHTDVTCSDGCKKFSRRRDYPGAWISRKRRNAIYLRDGFVCQICAEPVDLDCDPVSNWYPSLDHIVPRCHGGNDDPDNLRTAHRWCNSVIGDGTYYSDVDLRVA